jgi:signal transduction histidine kinase
MGDPHEKIMRFPIISPTSFLTMMIVIPVIVVGLYGVSIFEEELLDIKLEALEALALDKENELLSLIELRSEQVVMLARLIEPESQDIEDIQYHIDSVSSKNLGTNAIDIITITDETGKIIASSEKSLIGENVESSYIDTYQKTGKNFVGFETSQQSGNHYQTYVSKIKNITTNNSEGYAIIQVQPIVLNDFTSDELISELDLARLDFVNSDYLALTQVNEDPTTLLSLTMKSDALVDCFNGVDTYGEFVNYQNKEVFGVVEYIDTLDWCMVLEADLDVVLSDVNSFKNILYGLLVGLVALAIFLNVFVNRRIEFAKKEKEEFAAMITHDLKQTIFPVRYASNLLKESKFGKLSTEQLACVQDIDEVVVKQISMMDAMLSAQKIGAKAISYIMNSLIAKDVILEAIKNNEPLMGSKNIKLFSLLDENFRIFADRKYVLEILTNLILNSYDFVSEKGVIEVGATKQDAFVTFFVKDNGKGIPKDKIDNIFKPYGKIVSDMKRNFGGTGLGLAVSKALVEGMGGKIWVESEVDKETTFYFLVPSSSREFTERTYHKMINDAIKKTQSV